MEKTIANARYSQMYENEHGQIFFLLTSNEETQKRVENACFSSFKKTAEVPKSACLTIFKREEEFVIFQVSKSEKMPGNNFGEPTSSDEI